VFLAIFLRKHRSANAKNEHVNQMSALSILQDTPGRPPSHRPPSTSDQSSLFSANQSAFIVSVCLVCEGGALGKQEMLCSVQWFSVDFAVLQWFRSYLSDRSFRVVLGTSTSFLFYLLCSVPQGSVLGPQMFILYTADRFADLSSLSNQRDIFCRQQT